jgi:hypothetical protein
MCVRLILRVSKFRHPCVGRCVAAAVWLTAHSNPQRTLPRPDRHARALHALNTTDSPAPTPAHLTAAASDGPSVAQWTALATELRAIGGLTSSAWLAAQAQGGPVATWSWNHDAAVVTPPLDPAELPRAWFRYVDCWAARLSILICSFDM